MHDRVEQALELLGLDPVSEVADNHSHGLERKDQHMGLYMLYFVLKLWQSGICFSQNC